ncbi:phosphotransferase family protein [Ornithinimicrobium murale]|uniref:phosphotransferase family protein n=1 Tax=Ornithinimicrobium murale TaxID=1050153 RepID=UPI000E0DDED9|nr:phosphotransferase family protein [Ornithinimicrobium murale]
MNTAAAPAGDLPGLDLDRLREHLDRQAPHLLTGELTATALPGGKSNLTFRLDTPTASAVLRRPPLGHVLATAHDMGREARVLRAVADSPVPAPSVLHECHDPGVIGAPFYLMGYVPGQVYRTREQLLVIGPERTSTISHACLDTLLDLHRIDITGSAVAGLGHPDGFVERQVRRWSRQLESSRSRELPGVERLIEWLSTHLPRPQEPTIVHGDYRLDNLIVDDEDQVAAVLDWEMTTLGDPLMDVGLFQVYEQLSEISPGIIDIGTAPGSLTPEQWLQHYAESSGRDLSDIDFYVAFSAFKLAVILEGIHYRHQRGMTSGPGFAHIAEAVQPLITWSIDLCDRSIR